MRNSPPEVVHFATEWVSDVDAVGLPVQPVERRVVTAQVGAECQLANFSLGVVGVVDAHVGCAETEGGLVDNLGKERRWVSYCVLVPKRKHTTERVRSWAWNKETQWERIIKMSSFLPCSNTAGSAVAGCCWRHGAGRCRPGGRSDRAAETRPRCRCRSWCCIQQHRCGHGGSVHKRSY